MTFISIFVYSLSGLYAILSIWDVWSTIRFLRIGLAEANPFIRWTMKVLGTLWPVPKLALAGGVIAAATLWFPAGWAIVLLIPSCFLMVWVVWHNETQIARRKKRLGL